jgi:AraC-like DNA-binding protein
MSLLSKFVDSVNVRYYKSAFREVVSPVQLNGTVEDHNVIIHLNKGNFFVGKKNEAIKPDTFYFFPQGQKIHVKHGKGSLHSDLGTEGFRDDDHREQYVRGISGLSNQTEKKEIFTIVGFDLLLYNAISFFSLLEIPAFALPPDEEFAYLMKYIALEEEQNKLGREKILSNYTEEIVIHIFRYIDSQPHLKKYVEKLNFLTDKRLVDVVHYIQDNLDKDLSNKAIASIAYVSEDYVGQFFKSLTNHNLQEYIESQRLEKAFELLKSQPDNVQAVAHKVGFKDPAYFSRRFKMKFGSNAVKIKSENKNYVV